MSHPSPLSQPTAHRNLCMFASFTAGCAASVQPFFPLAQRLLCAAAWLAIVAAAAPFACGQGGAAISVGISAQNSANAAASQSASNTAQAAAPLNTAPSQSSSGRVPSGGPGSSSGGPGASGSYSGPESSEYGAEYGTESGMDYGADYGADAGYDMGPGYGMGPGGQPGSGGRGGQLAVGNLLGMASGALANSLADFFNRPLPESAKRLQPTLYEQAAMAMHQGDQRRALALYHAHLIAERESATAGLAAVRFSPLLRRPVWAVRLGVSINAKLPAERSDDPQPIRDGDRPGSARRSSGNLYGGSDDGGYGGLPQPARGRAANPALSAGELSGELSSAGGYDVGMEAYAPDYAAQAKPAAEPTTPGGSATVMAEEAIDRHLGLVAEVLKAQLTQRISAGKFGSALTELAAKGAELAAQQAEPAAAAPPAAQADQAIAMWFPGVDYVGTGIAAQAIERARENEIDLLFHFEIVVKETRGDEPQYVARCRVVNVATGDTLGATRLIDRREALLAARRSSIRSVVEELLAPAMDAVDSKASVQPLPQLAPQHAVARIDTLLASPQASRMNRLAEMAMFQHRGLIDQDQLEQAVFFAAGEAGLRLLHAEHEQRGELANQMILKQLGQD